MAQRPGIVSRLWFRWKSLQLPWRRQILAGYDLAGNTFWEFKDALHSNRMRRMVKYSRKTHHADVAISPQWHQWLRHTRPVAPSVQEQQLDLLRQTQLKQLASEADARWASQPSYLDAPSSKPQIGESATDSGYTSGERSQDAKRARKPIERPQAGGPGEGWQPQAWSPSAAAKR